MWLIKKFQKVFLIFLELMDRTRRKTMGKQKAIWWIPLLKRFRTCGSYARKTDTSSICCSFPLHVWGSFLSRQTSHKSQDHISSPAACRFHTSFLRHSLVRWSERRWRSRRRSPGASAASALEEPGSEPFTGSHRCRSSAHDLTGIQTRDRRPLMAHLYFIFYGIQKYVQLVFTSVSSNNLFSVTSCFILKSFSPLVSGVFTWWLSSLIPNCLHLLPLHVFSLFSACLRVLICKLCNLVSES